jgi:hypothetical protein
MFTRLKNMLLQRSIRLQNRHSVANKQFHSFDTARKVGILFLMEKNAIPREVQQLLDYLKSNRQFYFALGYYDQRENPSNFIATSRVAIFNKTNMNWYKRPHADCVDAFLHQNYDIVIDLCRVLIAPLEYVAKCANASTLIGGHFYEGCPYDLIVDAQKTCSLEGYIEQVKHYLTIITQPKTDATI